MTSDTSTTPAALVTWSADYGLSWTPDDGNHGELHSHALRVDDSVWVIDPIDAPNLDEVLGELGGTVEHVVVLLDRHMRDSVAVAERFGAQLHVVAGKIRQEVPEGCDRVDDTLEGSPFVVVPVRDQGALWCERALWWPEHALLVVAEALGSADAFTTGSELSIAVHPMLRLTPPRAQFARATPKVVLFGHGRAVTEDATASLQGALAESRTGAPKFAVESAGKVVSGILGKVR